MLSVRNGRRTGPAVGAAIALAVLGLSGCQGSSTQRSPAATTSTAATEPDLTLTGRFFASAGEAGNSDLYELRFGPVHLYRLTDVGRGGGVGACADRLVVATAHPGVDFRDTLQEFGPEGLGPVEGLGSPKASLPDLRTDCRLLYTEVSGSGTTAMEQLVQWDPASGTSSTLHSAEELGIPDWGPDGRIAVFQGRLGDDETPIVDVSIAVISPGGAVRTIESPVPEFGTIQWGDSPFMAIADEGEGTVFLDPDSGERIDLAGWVPLAWSPDATRLLVADAARRRDLGVVEASDLGAVRPAGTAGAPVYDAVWLPTDALAHIPPPTGSPDF